MMRLFDSKVAIVTGGASGIGLATVKRLVLDGARVASFDLSQANFTDESYLALEVDVTKREDISSGVEATLDHWGKIDLLVNSAGIGAAGTILDNNDDEWQSVFNVNVMGAVRVSQAVIPHLLKQSQSAIVNLASLVATTGFPNRALYSASKGAILSLTLAMASDYLGKGLRVNAVSPGTTETPWISRLLSQTDDPELARQKLVARQLHGRLVSAEEVADAVAYLLSPLAGSTNGIALPVDSGIGSLYHEQNSEKETD